MDRLTFENEIHDPARNRKVKRKLEIQAGAEGLPTVADMDVLDAFLLVGKETTGLQSPEILFSRYQMCDILGWPKNGTSYRRIEQAVRKWVTVTISYQAWWQRSADEEDDGGWTNLKGFHIFDSVELNDYTTGRIGRIKQSELPMSKVVLGKPFADSLSRGNMKRLNLADLFHLNLGTSKRLYRFLDKRFYHNPRLTFDLKTLACVHVGLSDKYKPADLKRKLQPAINELVEIGFLVEVPAEQRFTRVAHGVYEVHFQRASRDKVGPLPLKGPKTQRAADRRMIKELTERGVSQNVARKLVEDTSITPEFMRAKLEYFDWECATNGAPKRPGGWIRKAIEEDWQPPANFKTAEERKHQEQVARNKELEERERKRREKKAIEAEQQQARDEWEMVQAHLATLSEEAREALIDNALENPANASYKVEAQKFRIREQSGMPSICYELALKAHVLPLLEK